MACQPEILSPLQISVMKITSSNTSVFSLPEILRGEAIDGNKTGAHVLALDTNI